MFQTEYKGNKYIALLEECRNLGLNNFLFRGKYEISKKLGFVEKKHSAESLSTEDFIRSLDLNSPALIDIKNACDSHKIDKATTELIKHLKSRTSPKFFFNWRDREQYQRRLKEQFPDQEAQLLEQADRICRNDLEIFDGYCVDFGDHIDWHLEPSVNRNWPLEHWSKIDVRGANRIGDVRITWEINRHQFFLTLGRAYWFTGDEKYAREFADLLRNWLDENPPEIGVNWYSNLEIAIRLISWIWAYHYFLDSPFFDDKLHLDFLKTVLQSCRHITKDLQYSLHSMANNHVIGDATALVFASIIFPEFSEAKNWRDTYTDALYKELDKQVYDDGTDFEQSINYHRLVLYFYILLFRLMKINACDIPASVPLRMEKMIDFLMHTMKPDGTMPGIGDSDDARAFYLSNGGVKNLKPTLSTGAVLFQRGDFKYAAEKLNEETFWLCGKDSIQKFNSLAEFPPEQSYGFPDGGFYIMRSGDRYMLFKCGPHADHGHADALHIDLHCNGKNHLHDSGTYTYNGSWKWRTFFRSTQAHNTVRIDGESQSIPHRAFRWLKPAKSRAISWITSRGFDYIDAEHDGYSRYENPVIHRRSVFFIKPEYWIIIDRLSGIGEHLIELFFHSPHDKNELKIITAEPDELTAEVTEGWFSPCYGIKEPSTTLKCSYTGKLPKTIITVLDPDSSIDKAEMLDDRQSIVIESEKFRDILVLTGSETDAELAYLRRDKPDEKISRLALVSGKYLRLNGKTLLESEKLIKKFDLVVSSEGKIETEIEPEVDLKLEL